MGIQVVYRMTGGRETAWLRNKRLLILRTSEVGTMNLDAPPNSTDDASSQDLRNGYSGNWDYLSSYLVSSIMVRIALVSLVKTSLSRVSTVLYVLILSAALDLVPPSTPKGIIAFCNITPSLIVKVAWPYIFKGKIRYERRIFGCCGLSVMGMLV